MESDGLKWIGTISSTIDKDGGAITQISGTEYCGQASLPFTITRLDPTPYSPRVLGTPSYYRFRYEDFVRRNPDKQPPDYYLEFGEKYITRFLNETLPNLTPQGQEFLKTVAKALQKKIEDRLSSNPQDFATLEQNSNAFRKFAYRTHPDAYCESGWGSLPKPDRDKIIEAVDRRDLYFSIQGIITGTQLANRCGRFRDAVP